MFLEIVTPDDKVFAGEVESATFPGIDGSFQVLNNHAPMISTLQTTPGVVKVVDAKGATTEITIDGGGVLEVLFNKVILLAEAVVK